MATDGADALRQLETLPRPDLVTVNWQMPNMDGIEFLRIPVSPDLPRRAGHHGLVGRTAGTDRPGSSGRRRCLPGQTAHGRRPGRNDPSAAGPDSTLLEPAEPATTTPLTARPVKTPKLRVLIVDDSVTIRRTLTKVLDADPELIVCGAAADGRIALNCLSQTVPDVVLLDIEMPNLNGFETLRELRKDYPHLPVIMFSSLTERGAAATLDALMLGANDYVPKPAQVNSFEVAEQCIRDEVIPKIKQFGRPITVNGLSRIGRAADAAGSAGNDPRGEDRDRGDRGLDRRSGGVGATASPFCQSCPVPIVIVQHMPPIFTRYLAERLAADGRIVVQEGACGARLATRRGHDCSGRRSRGITRVGGQLQLQLNTDPPENSCRPAADVLFRSAAATCGAGTLAVVLTGMGKDGVRGCEQIVAAGGRVLVQDESIERRVGHAGPSGSSRTGPRCVSARSFGGRDPPSRRTTCRELKATQAEWTVKRCRMSMNQASLDFIRQLVAQRAAIILDASKGYLVQARLLPLARKLGSAEYR